MKTVRIGLIGCGPRGVRGLLKTCHAIQGAQVTAVCDKLRSLAEGAAAACTGEPVEIFTDHTKMLREGPVDAVLVVVEPENCPDLVIESLEAGKHVLSEVPMAFTLEDCWRIIHAVEKTGCKYMLGEQMRNMTHIQKWKEMNESGALGKILCAEGEYLHGMGDDRYYLDPETGVRLTLEQAAQHPCPQKSRFWKMLHPILYLPHELSPLLRVLDDRVVSVLCLGTHPPSAVHSFFPRPDFEIALMRTAKDALLRMSACFTAPNILRTKMGMGHHWHRVIGTKGCVETHRSDADKMKWLRDTVSGQPEEVVWEFDASSVSPEALASGHGGADYYPVKNFVDAILSDTDPEMNVYRAAESAAPAILAARSAELEGASLEVPDFRPGPHRTKVERADQKLIS